MQIQQINDTTVKATVDRGDHDLDDYHDNLIWLEDRNILTFGDTNYRVLEKYFKEHGYAPESLDLCFADDRSIGLEMPRTWYLNKGKHALSIAAYYNYLNFHGIVENKGLETFNAPIAKDYGRVACIEVYLEKELKKFLRHHDISYFSTPRTLTECVRYLEGWDIKKYPRLKGYATFSKYIELWSVYNFPNYDPAEWHLGKERSRQINESGLTNVRRAVKYFWQNHLLNNQRNISAEDVEVDILGGDTFHLIRQPKVILMSEDLFSANNSDQEIFINLTKKLSMPPIYLSKAKNGLPVKNARAAKAIYPDTLVVLIENHQNLHRNFSLINPIKQLLNADIVAATKILRHVLENYDAYRSV